MSQVSRAGQLAVCLSCAPELVLFQPCHAAAFAELPALWRTAAVHLLSGAPGLQQPAIRSPLRAVHTAAMVSATTTLGWYSGAGRLLLYLCLPCYLTHALQVSYTKAAAVSKRLSSGVSVEFSRLAGSSSAVHACGECNVM